MASLSLWLLVIFATCVIGQETSAQNATTFALIYGIPLLAYERFASTLVHTRGANQFNHNRVFQTAANRTVVKPNVDTLFSTLILDLSQSDVVVTMPAVDPSHFYLFSFYDPYGNNVANLGSSNFHKSGQYRVRMLPNTTAQYGLETSNSEPYAGYINLPSTFGTLLIRWGIATASDFEAVYGYQAMTKAENVTRTASDSDSIPTLHQILANVSAPAGSPQRILQLLATLGHYAPPEIRSDTERVNTMLSAAGVSNSSYTTQSNVNLTLAFQAATLTMYTDYTMPGVAEPLNNGWSRTASRYSGDYGTNYSIRAAIADYGYLMLKAPNALYPIWDNTSDPEGGLSQQQTLGSNEAYMYTFVGGQPPIIKPGFWSMTVYDAEGFLVPNSRNVYAIGDRNNITYSDGKLVYGGDNAIDNTGEGSFQILVQPADVPPPANWTSNWIPGPAGGGQLTALLRFYGAGEDLMNGVYQYPVITKQAAIAESQTPPQSSGTASPTSSETTPATSAAAGNGSPSVNIGKTATYAVTITVSLAGALLLFGWGG
ncbi:uncharacterized protein Z518_06687 [Rhinocladiella mackenziei CBS 650.93]|uniref:DUF1254 domain-containing protein n=1 Tax=Rhinocladiella mackenziei CBS 650.93 TaxID=1442369 RepID=A0A0D2IIL4_9EURO|nr:uncharacterized protein Z518_06687 [Rhinocladiella mackenziei CBS 650.93]KIX03136.1 hypothetical protein Z518_06687 [Rhinocladiella mackenziei CBS 650.93]